MKFEHDIFISYAPAAGSENNAVSEWSLKFCDYLGALMNRLYEKKPVIMLHDDLRVRQSMLGESLPGHYIRNSRYCGHSLTRLYSFSHLYERAGGYLQCPAKT